MGGGARDKPWACQGRVRACARVRVRARARVRARVRARACARARARARVRMRAHDKKVIVWMVLFDDYLALFVLTADISISSRFHPDHRPTHTKHCQIQCPERVGLWIHMQFHDLTLSNEIPVRSDPANFPRTLSNFHQTPLKAVFGRVRSWISNASS